MFVAEPSKSLKFGRPPQVTRAVRAIICAVEHFLLDGYILPRQAVVDGKPESATQADAALGAELDLWSLYCC